MHSDHKTDTVDSTKHGARNEGVEKLIQRFGTRGSRRKRALMWLIRLVILGGILVAVLTRVDFGGLLTNLSNARWEGILLALVLLELQPFTLALSWKRILHSLSFDFRYLMFLKASFVSLVINQFIPAAVGGMGARAVFAAYWGVPVGSAVNAVLIERAASICSLVLVTIATQFIVVNRYLAEFDFLPLVIGVLLILGTGVALLVERKFRPTLMRTKLGSLIANAAADFSLCLSQPKHLLFAICWTLVWHVLSGISIAILLWSIGVTVSPIALLALLPLVLIVSALPISINGWGVREAAMIGALSLEAVPVEQSLLASVLYGACVTISRTPGIPVLAFAWSEVNGGKRGNETILGKLQNKAP